MSDMAKKRYRVAQWATGNIGRRSLQAVIDHPQMDLVGLFVYSEAKLGRDAGELCERDRTGVIATNDIEDILAARPDCVLYMANRVELDVVCRLLESGANIVSTRSEFHHPASLEPSMRQRIEEACQKGGTSIYSTGSSPGFATEILPFAFAFMERRIDCITKEEFADMSSRNSPEMIFGGLGFGSDPASRPSTAWNGGAAGSMRMTMEALSLPIDDFTGTVEYAVARHRVEIAAGIVEAGTVGAQRTELTGMRNGKPVYRRRTCYYITKDIDPAWELRETGWHFVIEGDAPLDVTMFFPVPEEQYAATSPGFTAHPPINAVPYVCDAPPGMRTTDELPLMIGNFGL